MSSCGLQYPHLAHISLYHMYAPRARAGVRLAGAGTARNKTLDGAETVAWSALRKRVEELLKTGYTAREVRIRRPSPRALLHSGRAQLP